MCLSSQEQIDQSINGSIIYVPVSQRASQLAEALAKSANGKTVTKESGPNEKLVGGVRDSVHTQLSDSVRLRGRDSDEG
jgi:hypothetical protein